MNWAAEQRQTFISEMLRVYGFISRQHLMRKFMISNAQAAIDFREWKKANPEGARYDTRKKVYVANKAPICTIDQL